VKGIVRAILYGLATLVVAVAPAHAAGFLEETVKALASSPVYVVQGTDGTNSDTADSLKGHLLKSDRILIVMWPANSGDIDEAIRQLDEATKHGYIIGMSVGTEVRAIASYFPAGTAADLMGRASTVSTNTVETLNTFIQNVHNWQRLHPKVTPPEPKVPPGGTEKSTGHSFLVGIAIGVVILIIIFVTVAKLLRRNGNDHTDDVKLRSPSQMRDEMRELLELRSKIKDQSLRDSITQICQDVEAYFERTRTTSTKVQRTEDTQVFEAHLASVRDVVRRYVDVQNNPRYYDNPKALLEKGAEAVEGFAAFVLTGIKRNNRTGLTEFRVDTDILSAQRYA